MTKAIKSLGDGQLAANKGTIYTCPTAKQAIISKITLVNTHSSALVVNLYFKASGGTSRNITPVGYSLATGALLIMKDELTLEAADVIEGSGGTASLVDYVISGEENT